MAHLLLDEEIVKKQDNSEEIQGETLFSLKNLFMGILIGGRDYVDEVNAAINEAYAEEK